MPRHARRRANSCAESAILLNGLSDPTQTNLSSHKWLACGQGKEDVRSNIKSSIHPMKRLLLSVLFVAIGFKAFTLLADDAQFLTGKWSVKKVNDQGQRY